MKNNSEKVLVCFQLLSFLSEAVNSIIPDRGLTQSSEPEYGHYGNTGCGVFKGGVQNKKDFCLRINMLKGNY